MSPGDDTAAKPASTGTVVLLAQLLVATIVIVAYVVLTITNHDGTPLLGILGGQAIGGVIQNQASR